MRVLAEEDPEWVAVGKHGPGRLAFPRVPALVTLDHLACTYTLAWCW